MDVCQSGEVDIFFDYGEAGVLYYLLDKARLGQDHVFQTILVHKTQKRYHGHRCVVEVTREANRGSVFTYLFTGDQIVHHPASDLQQIWINDVKHETKVTVKEQTVTFDPPIRMAIMETDSDVVVRFQKDSTQFFRFNNMYHFGRNEEMRLDVAWLDGCKASELVIWKGFRIYEPSGLHRDELKCLRDFIK